MQTLDASLYPVIFARKSTRTYRDDPMPQETEDKLKHFLDGAVPLFPQEKYAFDIVPHADNTRKIAAYAEETMPAYINLAFMLQQADLFLQANGLGALWLGMDKPTPPGHGDLPYGISLVFGLAKGSPVRESIGQFKRRASQQISNRTDFPFVEAVRLAPSAGNRQPWYLMCEDGSVDFYCKNSGLVLRRLYHNLPWFDIGIAACQAVLALQSGLAAPEAEIKPLAPKLSGYSYAMSLQY